MTSEMMETVCAKCGKPIMVDKSLIPMGATITIMHEECVAEVNAQKPVPKRKFKVTVTIFEMFDDSETPVAGFGEYAEAPSFKASLPLLSESLGRLWERIQEHASIADLEEEEADPSE